MSPSCGPLAFLDGIGFSEMLLIAFLSILVFGGRLPEVLRNLGRGYAKFRQGLHDVSRPIRDEIQRATTLPEGSLSLPTALQAGEAAPPASTAPPEPPGTYEPAAPPTGPAEPAPAGGPAPAPWPSASPSRDPYEEPPPV
jgi:sec-independent protein translocase protein TatA